MVRRCINCIIPETFERVHFNEKGLCQFCQEFSQEHLSTDDKLGEAALIQALDLNSNSNKGEYDCVVPISGGKDSIFILYYAVKKLKIRPIAVTSDTGFTHTIARENMENACRILNVPLITRVTGDIHKKIIREVLAISEEAGLFVRKFCINCGRLHVAAANWVAKNYQVNKILWGSDPIESAIPYERLIPKGNRSHSKIINYFTTIGQELPLNPLKLLRISPHLAKYYYLQIMEKRQMGIPVKFFSRGIDFPSGPPGNIYFYRYISWDNIRQLAVLKQELNWKHPENKESRFDCLLHCFADHRFLQSFGISHNGLVLCNFIRSGHMLRETGLLKEEQVRNGVEKECQELIKSLDIENYKMPKLSLD